ncbi:MAG: phosphoribosyltransferase [Candidatus Eisenbacteria bacterium]|nr:phosphoribosyltransferase [Candidatus Eisenbacteria bacterium]
MAIHIDRHVPGPLFAFEDRIHAGRELASFMALEPDPDALVLALPRGGVPVARPIAVDLRATVEPVVVRKLPIPESPEMGFGAVAIDGTTVLNEGVVRSFSIPMDTIGRVAGEVRREVERRAREYAGTTEPPNVEGKTVYLVDDGLATGYSMLVAARMVAKRGPASIRMAVPVSPIASIELVDGVFDEKYCLLAQDSPPFAVASFYRDFHEMTDEEVRQHLQAGARSGR